MENGNSVFSRIDLKKYVLKKNLKHDLSSSLVVFFVALPLCLGIALPSGAPLFAGILTGMGSVYSIFCYFGGNYANRPLKKSSYRHGIIYLLFTENQYAQPCFYRIQEEGDKIRLAEEVSFLNKAAIQVVLKNIPKETNVIIDGTHSRHIDPDVLETTFNFQHNAYTKNIIVTLEKLKKRYKITKLTDKIIQDSNKK